MVSPVLFAFAALTGCADFTYSYVESATLPIVIQDIGPNCETDDPLDSDIARVHVEAEANECVITADVLARAIEYQDIEDDFDFDLSEGEWTEGGICAAPADADAVEQPWEKCDYGPKVTAHWRLAGDDAWLQDPQFANDIVGMLDITYYSEQLDSLDNLPDDEKNPGLPALEFTTTGGEFPLGNVVLTNDNFALPFVIAAPEDLWSVVHAEVRMPLQDATQFSEHEYKIDFSYQMYVAGELPNQSLIDMMLDMLFGGGDE